MITDEILRKYQVTVGIECHVQLATKTKLFSGADNDAREADPNTKINPIDFALPGMLPVLNKDAIRLAIIAGKALNASINKISRFDRKHYFYPDLPKGYQISQMYNPLILSGHVDVPLDDGSFYKVRINHAHVEEDAGKLTHFSDYTLIDLNRAGTPLVEIVSEPDIHSAEVAKAYVKELYRLMTYAGVTIGDLYHGNMRFDVNISVNKPGDNKLGNRAEIKNLNSFRSVEKAVDYEYRRQVDVVERGGTIDQETRGWNEAKQKTITQRSKENAQDYRYMPDPDIPPIVLNDKIISNIQKDMPKLPSYYRDKWNKLDLDQSVVESLLDNPDYANLISEIQDRSSDGVAKRVAYWFSSAVNSDNSEAAIVSSNFSPDGFIELANMVDNKELSSTAAKEVFNELLVSGETAHSIAKNKNLLQVSDEATMTRLVDKVLADPLSRQSIIDIKEGKIKAIGYLIGQAMKLSKGKANPEMAKKIIINNINNSNKD